MSFDAGSITASMDIDRTAFKEALAAAKAEADKGVKVRVTADSSQLKAEGDKAGQDLGKSIDQGVKKGLSSGGTRAHGGGSWIATAIGLGAPLAGPLAVAGLGFVAFGALAVKSVLPIVKAISGPGGIAGAWGTLDNRQRVAVQSTRALGREYSRLAQTLEPRVFQSYNIALGFGNQLLERAAPLAHNAAIGINQFLVQFENRAGLQQFVSFASGQAIPTITAIGTTLTSTVHLVLNLAKNLTPLGLSELSILNNVLRFADDSVTALSKINPALVPILAGTGQILLIANKLRNVRLFGNLLAGAGGITGFSKVFDSIGNSIKSTSVKTAAFSVSAGGTATALKEMTIAERGATAAGAALDAINPLGWAVLGTAAVVGAILYLNKFGTEAGHAADRIVTLNKATGFSAQSYLNAAKAVGEWDKANESNVITLYNVHTGLVTTTGRVGDLTGATAELTGRQKELIAQGSNLNTFLGQLQQRYGVTRTQAIQLAQAAGIQAKQVTAGGQAMHDATQIVNAYADSNRKAHQPVTVLTADLAGFRNTTLTTTERVKDLNDALNQFFNPAVTADQDVIQMKNDLVAMNTALDKSAGKTGLLTQSQRDARGTFDTYISQVQQTATDVFKATGRASDYDRVIRNALPGLERAAGHNKTLRREIQLLQDTMKQQEKETVSITVKAAGTWSVAELAGGIPIGGGKRIRTAGGGIIPGYAPGRDIRTADVSPGEGILVPEAVRAIGAGTVLSLNAQYGNRNSSGVGYAGGGVVGSISGGSVPGLRRWDTREEKATIEAVASATAKATAAGIIAAQQSARSTGFGGISGGGGGGPNVAIGQRMAASIGWTGSDWAYLRSGWMEESGWRTNAQNPAGGPYDAAYGIPQSNPGSKMAAAGKDWLTNPVTQIRWGLGYIRSTYGRPTHVPKWSANGPTAGYVGYAGGTGGAAPGWAMVGEQGPELVRMLGGEMVMPHSDSMAAIGMPGYAKGTKHKDDPQRKAWLRELARFVKTLDKDQDHAQKERRKWNKFIAQDELWLLTHPGVGRINKQVHEKALETDQRMLHRFNVTERKKEGKLAQEIHLLRVLTNFPPQKRYGGPGTGDGGAGDGAGAGDGGGGDAGGGDAGGGTTGPGGFAGPTPAWLLPYADGATSNGNAGFSQSDSSSGFGGTVSTGGGTGTSGISSGTTVPFAGMLGNNASTEAQLLALLVAKHTELVDVMKRSPQQTAGGVADAITGVTRLARLRTGRG